VTDKQLAELEQLLAAASPPPWRAEHSDTDDIEAVALLHPHGTVCMEAEDAAGAWEDETRDTIVRDLTLAAEARNILPAIFAELKRHRGADRPHIVG
jgi:hypothetical protein